MTLRDYQTESFVARPPVKFVGGKRLLAPAICEHMPQEIDRYVEPFCGGAAVFFHLYNEGRIGDAAVHLSDTNSELIALFQAIRDDPDQLVAYLRDHAVRYVRQGRDYFLAVRSQDPRTWTNDARVGARFVFLNKTGFNGLYRVNRSGLFNVPHGSFKSPPVICDEPNLFACHRALQNVDLSCEDYKGVLDREAADPEHRCVVYIDSPYVPISKTSNFVSYDKDGFSRAEHEALAERAKLLARALQGKGRVICSNSSSPLVRELYEGGPFVFHEIMAKRSINSKGDRRGEIKELLMVSTP